MSDRPRPPSGSTAPSERRASPRVPYRTRIDIVLPDGTSVVGLSTVDLSSSGMFIATDRPVSPGSAIIFGFRPEPQGTIVRGGGRVQWRRTEGIQERPAGIGVAITSLSEEGTRELAQLLAPALGTLSDPMADADTVVETPADGTPVVPSGETAEREAGLGVTSAPEATPVPVADDDGPRQPEENAGGGTTEVLPPVEDVALDHVDGESPEVVPPADHVAAEEWRPAEIAVGAAADGTADLGEDEPFVEGPLLDEPDARDGDRGERDADPSPHRGSGPVAARPVTWPPPEGGAAVGDEPASPRWVGPVVATAILAVAVVVLLVLPRLGRHVNMDHGDPARLVVEGSATDRHVSGGVAADDLEPGSPLQGEDGVSTGDSGVAVPGPPGVEQAAPIAAAGVTSVGWRPLGDGAELLVDLDGPLDSGRVDDLELSDPRRYLVRVEGISRPPSPGMMDLEDAPIPARLGYHPELRPPELHLVVELDRPGDSASWLIRDGHTLVVRVSR